MPEHVVAKARFESKLRLYIYLRSIAILTATVVGIVLLPIWIFVGWSWARRYFNTLRCELTERRLRIHKGVIYQQDKTIPLDKIQDLSLRHGPVLRAMGLCSLRVETAGQSSPQGQADADLIGIVDAREFQEMVLAQRDRLDSQIVPAGEPRSRAEDASGTEVLFEIRDTLQRIETHLRSERPKSP